MKNSWTTAILKWFRLTFGFASVPEICKASKGVKDYHDYPIWKGGDGDPKHCYEYKCWCCGKRFTI